MIKNNGCNEDGWDLYEESTRKEFEEYACRQGYDLTRDAQLTFLYAQERTEDAWRMFHMGHVKGRMWG